MDCGLNSLLYGPYDSGKEETVKVSSRSPGQQPLAWALPGQQPLTWSAATHLVSSHWPGHCLGIACDVFTGSSRWPGQLAAAGLGIARDGFTRNTTTCQTLPPSLPPPSGHCPPPGPVPPLLPLHSTHLPQHPLQTLPGTGSGTHDT